MLNRDVRARRQAPPQVKLRHSLTAPAGGWIRRRRERKETERRRAVKRPIDFTLRENLCVFRSGLQVASIFLFLGRGRRATD